MSYSQSTDNTISGGSNGDGSGDSGQLLLNGDLGFFVVGNGDSFETLSVSGPGSPLQSPVTFGGTNAGNYLVPAVIPNATFSHSSGGSGTGGSSGSTTQIVDGTASAGLVIDIVYDSSVTSLATATKNALEGAVNIAVQYLESLFTNHTTITLDIGYGEIDGSAMASNALGESEAYWYTESYSQVRSILQSENAPGASTLPATSPFKGTIVTSLAQAQALGLASSGSVDGYIGITSSYPLDYTTATPASNQYYLVGILEHEMTEDMGRVSWLNYQPTYYSIADLYRYSSSGVRDLTTGGTGSTAYFSINNGATNLGTWNNQVSNGDLADWYPSGPAPGGYDAFNDYSSPGVVNIVSANDITLMEALGWTTAAAAVGPTITSVTEAPPTGDLNAGKTVTITLGFSEVVTVTGTPTLALNDGGTATYSSGSNSSALVFTYTVGASDRDVSSLAVSSINLTGATIVDGSGNALNPSLSGVTQTGPQIDTTIPTITAIGESPSTGDLNAGKTVTITLTLNESVTVTGTPTLALNDGGTATYSSGSGGSSLVFTYKVQAGDNDVSSLAVSSISLNGGTIQDTAGNSFNILQTLPSSTGPQIDTTIPVISSVAESPSTGVVGIGKTVSITLGLNEAVTVTGTPTLALNDGGTATYSSGSGTSSLVFTYTVVSSNSSEASLAVDSISLTGATIQDGAGNSLNLVPALPTSSGPTIDTTVPTVTGVGASPSTGVEGTGATVTLTLTMSEDVTVTGTPKLTLSDGATASYDAAESTATSLAFNYAVAAGQYAATLGITGVNLSGATIASSSSDGNAANLAAADTSFAGLSIDGTTPVVTGVRDHDTLGSTSTVAAPGVLAHASDTDTSDTLTVSAVDGVAGDVGTAVAGSFGSLTLNANGSYSYTNTNSTAVTAAGGVAVDIFSYTVSNGDGGTASSTLSIVITNSSQTYIGGTSGVTLTGGTGSYVIDGGAGSDTLTAGKGTQVLIGGPGDTLTANTASGSSDLFVFAPGFGKDTITNFNTSTDKIQLSHTEFANFAAVQADAHQTSSHGTYTTTITYDANDVITLTGVQLSHLTSSDFIFA